MPATAIGAAALPARRATTEAPRGPPVGSPPILPGGVSSATAAAAPRRPAPGTQTAWCRVDTAAALRATPVRERGRKEEERGGSVGDASSPGVGSRSRRRRWWWCGEPDDRVGRGAGASRGGGLDRRRDSIATPEPSKSVRGRTRRWEKGRGGGGVGVSPMEGCFGVVGGEGAARRACGWRRAPRAPSRPSTTAGRCPQEPPAWTPWGPPARTRSGTRPLARPPARGRVATSPRPCNARSGGGGGGSGWRSRPPPPPPPATAGETAVACDATARCPPYS